MDKKMMLKSRKQKKEEDEAKGCAGCALVIAIPVVLFALLVIDDANNSISPSSSDKTQSVSDAPPIERRTSTGVPIERGADIDPRIDRDKLINLSVSRIRSEGHRCNSLSSIDLFKHNKSIVVRCNGGKYRYRVYPASGWVTTRD